MEAEKKRLEEELCKKELLMRTINDASTNAIILINPHGRIYYWNQSAVRIFGYTCEEVLGQELHFLLTPESYKKMFEQVFPGFQHAGHSDGPEQPWEMKALRKNGDEFPIELFFSSVELRDGWHNIGIVQDITNYVRLEKKLLENREWLHEFTNELPAMVCEFLPDSTLTFVNPAYCEFFGSSCEDLIGRSFLDFSPEKEREASKEKYMCLTPQQPVTTAIYKAVVCGEIRELEWRYRAFFDKHGQMVKLLGIGNDVTERERAKNSLENQIKFEKLVADISNAFVRLPSEQIHEAINYTLKQIGEFFQVDRCYVFLFSEDGKYMSITHEWCADGIEPEMKNMQDQPIESLPWLAEQTKKKQHVNIADVDSLPLEAEAERKKFKSQHTQSVLSIPLTREEIVYRFLVMEAIKNKKVWTETHIILLRTEAELISNAYTRFLAENEIQYLTFHDSLTGLYNRRYLENEMKRLDTERQLPIGLIMSDLNNFKMVNDINGHDAGDEMLKYTAEIMRNSCRREDIIVRLGGDEFVILLPQTTIEDTRIICTRINENFQVTYVQGNPVSMALGYAIKDSPDTELADILKQADKNMYIQKLVDKSKKDYRL